MNKPTSIEQHTGAEFRNRFTQKLCRDMSTNELLETVGSLLVDVEDAKEGRDKEFQSLVEENNRMEDHYGVELENRDVEIEELKDEIEDLKEKVDELESANVGN